jgi:hypothetical protein
VAEALWAGQDELLREIRSNRTKARSYLRGMPPIPSTDGGDSWVVGWAA